MGSRTAADDWGDLLFRHRSATEPTGGSRLRPSSRGFFASRKSNLEKGFSRSLIAEGNELRMLRNLQGSRPAAGPAHPMILSP